MDMATVEDFRDAGFKGFLKVSVLQASRCTAVPTLPGIYAVLRPEQTKPVFLESSIAGHFKGQDPSAPIAELQEAWVQKSVALYMGKAGGPDSTAHLRDRVLQFMQFGAGKPVGHPSGKNIWQLADSGDLYVCWMLTGEETPVKILHKLVFDFRSRYGKRPFANPHE
jgi:hypothetical protein